MLFTINVSLTSHSQDQYSIVAEKMQAILQNRVAQLSIEARPKL